MCIYERERVGDGRECESVKVGGRRERVRRWGRERVGDGRERVGDGRGRERGGNGSVCVRETN